METGEGLSDIFSPDQCYSLESGEQSSGNLQLHSDIIIEPQSLPLDKAVNHCKRKRETSMDQQNQAKKPKLHEMDEFEQSHSKEMRRKIRKAKKSRGFRIGKISEQREFSRKLEICVEMLKLQAFPQLAIEAIWNDPFFSLEKCCMSEPLLSSDLPHQLIFNELEMHSNIIINPHSIDNGEKNPKLYEMDERDPSLSKEIQRKIKKAKKSRRFRILKTNEIIELGRKLIICVEMLGIFGITVDIVQEAWET